MNLLLLEPEELDGDGLARLAGRRLVHAREVLQGVRGDRLRVGVRGGLVGEGEILSIDERELLLRARLSEPPPARPGIDLLLGMPRPKALRRILPALASFGVDRVVLLNAASVEKSYFATPLLAAASICEEFSLGLEQARDTIAPTLLVRERFRPFVEDELDALVGSAGHKLIAHPGEPQALLAGGRAPGVRIALAVGPEGGWNAFELGLLEARGFVRCSLGVRALRTEVVLPALLGALLDASHRAPR